MNFYSSEDVNVFLKFNASMQGKLVRKTCLKLKWYQTADAILTHLGTKYFYEFKQSIISTTYLYRFTLLPVFNELKDFIRAVSIFLFDKDQLHF